MILLSFLLFFGFQVFRLRRSLHRAFAGWL